jgi:hypothetical protein
MSVFRVMGDKQFGCVDTIGIPFGLNFCLLCPIA